jgi:hypothetical protein
MSPEESLIKISTCNVKWMEDQLLTFQLTKLQDSMYMYVGSETLEMKTLSIAMPNRRPKTSVSSTNISGSSERMDNISSTTLITGGLDDPTETIARRLSSKFKKQVLLTFNCTIDSHEKLIFIERELICFLNTQI